MRSSKGSVVQLVTTLYSGIRTLASLLSRVSVQCESCSATWLSSKWLCCSKAIDFSTTKLSVDAKSASTFSSLYFFSETPKALKLKKFTCLMSPLTSSKSAELNSTLKRKMTRVYLLPTSKHRLLVSQEPHLSQVETQTARDASEFSFPSQNSKDKEAMASKVNWWRCMRSNRCYKNTIITLCAHSATDTWLSQVQDTKACKHLQNFMTLKILNNHGFSCKIWTLEGHSMPVSALHRRSTFFAATVLVLMAQLKASNIRKWKAMDRLNGRVIYGISYS